MTQKHTPGPWSASAPDGSFHDVIRIFADADPEGALPVAICPQRQSAIMSVLSGQSDATTEAAGNARLIAAAPEMHDDLRSAWAVLSIILENGWIPEQHRAPVKQCRDNAARSLTRARGETA